APNSRAISPRQNNTRSARHGQQLTHGRLVPTDLDQRLGEIDGACERVSTTLRSLHYPERLRLSGLSRKSRSNLGSELDELICPPSMRSSAKLQPGPPNLASVKCFAGLSTDEAWQS